MKTRVIAHRGKLVIIPSEPEKGVGDGWWPTGGTRLGCVVSDTATRLGVSDAAVELIRGVQRGSDDLGDVSWWKCDDGTWAFGWLGPLYVIYDPTAIVTSRTSAVPADCHRVRIDDDLSSDDLAAVNKAIDAMEAEELEGISWQQPLAVDSAHLLGQLVGEIREELC